MRRVRKTFAALIFTGLVALPMTGQAQSPPPFTTSAAPPPFTTPASPTAVTDSFDSTLQRAQQLTQAERHQEALAAWQAAYAMRQRPGLLFEIGRAQQRLGQAAEAAASFRRFLTADPNPPPALKQEAEQSIIRLERLSTAGLIPIAGSGAVGRDELAAALPYKVIKRRYHGGMRAGGITLFAIGYAAAFLSGIIMGPIFVGSNSRDDKAIAAGSFCLLIPVAGPFLSGIVTPSVGASSGYSGSGSTLALIWTLPWLLTSGGMQASGVGMWVGAYKHPQNVIVPNLPEVSWRITPYSTRDGAGMAATVNF